MIFRPQACNFIKNETVAQVFSCEFYKIFKNTFFTEHLWATASEYLILGFFFPNDTYCPLVLLIKHENSPTRLNKSEAMYNLKQVDKTCHCTDQSIY